MGNRRLLGLLVLVFAAPAAAQQVWAHRAEYELYERALQEVEPARQIEVLLEWDAAYPSSVAQRARIAMLVSAYERAGRPADAFARATQLFKLDPSDINALSMTAALAPSLQAPSPEQIRITEEAANNLLSRLPEVRRMVRTVPQPATAAPSPQARDPEAERVDAVIRAWRRGKRIRSADDAEDEVRAVAERALAWVKSASK